MEGTAVGAAPRAMTAAVVLRPLSSSDLDNVARIHTAAFPDTVLTALGAGPVRRYYEWQMAGPHAMDAAGVTVDGRLAGFSFLVRYSDLGGFVRRNLFALAWAVLRHPGVIRRARFQRRLVQGVRSLRATSPSGVLEEEHKGVIRLLSIAVDPQFRRLRLGQRMLETTETAARVDGQDEIGLSVHPDNAGAVALYERNGWRRVPVAGVWRGEMRKRLPPAPGSNQAEILRIRSEYARRAREIPADLYAWSRAANRFFFCQTYRECIQALVREKLFPLNGRRVADIGCGYGGWLLEFCQWGADPAALCGIDLEESRIEEARRKLPAADLVCGNAESLPWADASMDLVSQFTMMTSILDGGVRRRVAAEMLRIVKPGGLILWYDFRVDNPFNPGVKGVRKAEIKSLFPGCSIILQSITLAPPLARRVVPVSWILALVLNKIPAFRTHYLGIIRPRPGSQ